MAPEATSAAPERQPIIEPATEEVLATVPLSTAAEVDDAVHRAHAAQPEWARRSPEARAAALCELADALAREEDELARLEARNVGKPIADARGEIRTAAAAFRYYAGGVERLTGSTIPVAGGVDVTFFEPIGLVALITPWNFPLAIAGWKVAPALAAGNSVVLKPSELTPLTALRLGEIAAEALGEDVLRVVNGTGPTVGRQLVEHPLVGKIGFTGSTAVGREIAATAGAAIKRVSLELGGKSANVIFDDADLEAAATAAPGGVFANSGQDCCARSRVLVQASVLDEFLEMFEAATRAFVVGDPLDPETQMGPLISGRQRDRVAGFLDDEVDVVFRGDAPEGAGFWFPPTILSVPDPGARVFQEEIFGPVAAITTFEDEAEAIALANSTVYGLSGSIWTRDGARALRVARAIESGALSINSNSSVRLQTPFGGFRQSGLGRELGPEAIKEYTELKNVFISTEP
ncbi:MAG TPA: aldehyde dehydrogenase family protein [Solirubrobacterales bacterium]|nr:aldehyde dehydrogenase family protein [Solirubrobacterales bacterium]